jgi:hypothetical protein
MIGLDAEAYRAAGRRPPPDWFPVDSSNVAAIRYVGPGWLDVRFLAKGKNPRERTWRWHDVPVDVFWEMLEAPSKGKYVHHQLRPRYGDGVEI